MKILMFSTHAMKCIWCSPQKSKYPLYTKQGPNSSSPHTVGATISNESRTSESPPYNGQQLRPLGSLNIVSMTDQIFALDSAVQCYLKHKHVKKETSMTRNDHNHRS